MRKHCLFFFYYDDTLVDRTILDKIESSMHYGNESTQKCI